MSHIGRRIAIIFIIITISIIILMSDVRLRIKRNIGNKDECRDMDKTMSTIGKSYYDDDNNIELEEETWNREDEYGSGDAVNDTAVIIEDETVITKDAYKILKRMLKCHNREYKTERKMRSEYWVLQNYAKAEHGDVECYKFVTLATHSDFTFMDNLEILVKRWQAPISISLFAPGTDFYTTVQAIRYMKDCSSAKDLINLWIRSLDEFSEPFICLLGKPHKVKPDSMYKIRKHLLYPVNVARNIARDAALTHYFLSLDIELYPIPIKLGSRFLNMVARNTSYIKGNTPRVYVLKPFEVKAKQKIPENKTTLQRMLKEKTAVPFHEQVCYDCHQTPCSSEWSEQAETPFLEVTGIGKRTGSFEKWEPLFISTHSIPYQEERLSWDGKRDKMTQMYVLCVMDYEFFILNNAFVTHHPGIKNYVPDKERESIVRQQSEFIDNKLYKELKAIYGTRIGCVL